MILLLLMLIPLAIARSIPLVKLTPLVNFTGNPLPSVEITCNGWKVRKLGYRFIGTTG